jgi:carbon-monoxide dehydrogenase iron sulfur subunit
MELREETMAKIMVVDHERCTGCRLCEMVCSVKKEAASDPSRSRIHVIKWEMEGFYLPMFCQHCEEPLCAAVCPVNAVEREESSGRVVVDHDRCVGCRACVSACPLGGVGFDNRGKKVLRCDLCEGDPTCVKYCDTRAIQYLEADQVQLRKKRSAAEKLYRAFQKGA